MTTFKEKLLASYTIAATPHPLNEALKLWVDKWKPESLIKLWEKDPQFFRGFAIPKTTFLYRIVYMTRKDLDRLLAGKSWSCKRALESWSTNPKLENVGMSFEHKKDPDNLAVVLKKRVPVNDRVLYVPDLHGHGKVFKSDKLSADFIDKEAEVIVKCQTINADDVQSITDPYSKKKMTVEKYRRSDDQAPLWRKMKEKAIRLAKGMNSTPEYGVRIGPGFAMQLMDGSGNAPSDKPPGQVYLRDTKNGVQQRTDLSNIQWSWVS